MKWARAMRRKQPPRRCKGCAGPLYLNTNPYSDRTTFCNTAGCPESTGKPLPPDMLADYKLAR